MTHEPLMLSDTAMVLLNRYIECLEEHRERLDNLPSAVGRYELSRFDECAHGVIDDFMHELEILWWHRDLDVTRYLDWHFVLHEDFVRQCRIMFDPLRGHQPDVMRERAPKFMYDLADAYQKALKQQVQPDTDE